LVKIPGADKAGPSGRTEKAGAVDPSSFSRPVRGAEKPALSSSSEPPVPRILSALAQVLGLPRDGLSASIISFARYFSLPLNPDLLTKIRRDSLAAAPRPSGETVKTGDPPQGRDIQSALALASAAAAAKGLELSREALTAYALALAGQGPLDPDQSGNPEQSGGGSGQGPGGGGPGGGDGASGRGGDDGSPGGHAPGGGGRDGGDGGSGGRGDFRGGLRAGDLIRADRLREKLPALGEQNPLLDLLNRAPGKNGEHWVVLPFTFSRDDAEYRAVLRILIDKPFSEGSPGRMALDISGGNREGPILRWLFIYDRPAGEAARLKARFWPPESAAALRSFKKELSRLLFLHSKEIDLQNDEKNPIFAPDCRISVLHSINKEV
jgi:hypothetical protein